MDDLAGALANGRQSAKNSHVIAPKSIGASAPIHRIYDQKVTDHAGAIIAAAIALTFVLGAEDMQDIGKRLLMAMKARGIPKQYLFADLLSVDQSTVTRWISGKGMSITHAIAICDQLNLSMDWLILGIGEMDRANHNSGGKQTYSVEVLSEEAKHIIINTIKYMTSIEGVRSKIAFSSI